VTKLTLVNSDTPPAAETTVKTLGSTDTQSALDIVKALSQISDPAIRQALADLTAAIARAMGG
jgi:hypothetical protein